MNTDLVRAKSLPKLSKRMSVRNLSIRNVSFDEFSASIPTLDEDKTQLVESLSIFVPLPVMTALQTESNHQIGELRTVTTMFLSLDSYDPIIHADPSSLQPFFLIAQQIMEETGGFLRQFLVDDKGCVLIVMWGIPLYTFSNNCSRALYCAFQISQRIQDIQHKCSVGITTGTVFCGTIGSIERSDYVGIGNEVNLAARFMAKAYGKIFVDHTTYKNLNEENRYLLTLGDALQLKGMPAPIQPYVYMSTASPALTLADTKISPQNKLLKKKIMQTLDRQLDRLGISIQKTISPKDVRFKRIFRAGGMRSRKSEFRLISNSNFTILCGPAGSGEKTAAEYFRVSARERGMQTIHLQAKSQHRSIPYGIMRDLFTELVGEEVINSPDHSRIFVNNLIDETFGDEPDNKVVAMMTMNCILGTSFQDNRMVKSTTSSNDLRVSLYGPQDSEDSDDFEVYPLARSKTVGRDHGDLSFHRILSSLLKNTVTAIVIEDAQHCDELSWNELYLLLSGSEINVCILLAIQSRQASKGKMFSYSSERGIGSPRFSGAIKSTPALSNYSFLSERSHSINEYEDLTSGEVLEKLGLHEYKINMLHMIISNPNAQLIELKPLTEEEVKALLLQTLKIETISNEMVRLVMTVSSGNTYWVKSIANFIKEQGIKHLEAALGSKASSQGPLMSLIVCRLDLLDAESKIVVKYASVVGFEFTAKLIGWIVPLRKQDTTTGGGGGGGDRQQKRSLVEILSVLEKHGFIYCVMETPYLVYSFQNEILQKTVYETILPRYSSLLLLLLLLLFFSPTII
jgi:hypothetical protein